MNLKDLANKAFRSESKYLAGGEVFEALHNVEVSYMTHFMAPFTGGAKASLLKGERIIISKPVKPKPVGYYAYPLNDEEVEERIVPNTDKDDPKYNGFSLSVSAFSLEKDFKRVELAPIKYVKGDATEPRGSDERIIVHICNDVGGWGKGFVTAISKKWTNPEAEYRKWHKTNEGVYSDTTQFEKLERRDRYMRETTFGLGNVQFVKVTDKIWIANMVAQRDIKRDEDGIPPIRYTYVDQGLERVRNFAKRHAASVHMPRIGCGLAGGEWSRIEEIINENLIAHEVETTVYDFD